MRELLGGQVIEGRRGRVRFRASVSSPALEELRSVERRHVWLGELSLPPDDSAEARETIRRILFAADLGPYLEAVAEERNLPEAPAFRITARREGEHAYSSNEIAGWAGQALVDRFAWPVDLEEFDLEIFVRVEDDRGWIAGRLPGPSNRRRDWQRAHHPAALNPVIAYAMVRLAAPEAGYRIHDPFVGGGTLPIEGALWEPGARWSGSDKGPGPLDMARSNAAAAGVHLPLARAEADRLPLRSGTLDRVLANMPFGRRSGSHRRNRHLYGPFLEETARVLRPGGRAWLLTLERRLMEELLEDGPLEVVSQRLLSQSGLHPRLWELAPR